MSATETLKTTSTTGGKAAIGRLFFLEASGGRIHSANADGSDRKVIINGARVPDGIDVDVEAGHIYWTNMGIPSKNEGSIERADLDDQNCVTIIDIPKGEDAANRTDIELLFDALPEPIDLELDLKNRLIYWTDRGDPPRGNTVNRASIDADFTKYPTPDIILTHLMEGIGIALDFKGDRMFLTDLAGTIYSAKLDGTQKKPLLVAQGNLTGIAYAEIPADR